MNLCTVAKIRRPLSNIKRNIFIVCPINDYCFRKPSIFSNLCVKFLQLLINKSLAIK